MKRLVVLSGLLLLLTGCARTNITNNSNSNNASSAGGIVQRSFYMDQAFYERAFTGNQPVESVPSLVAGIVPHHLLASHQIARWFEGARSLKPSVVVVIGPNHNEIGNGPVLSSLADWNTPYGELREENKLIKRLDDLGLVNIDERVFTQEHSISAEVSFIKRTWPETSFVPIILKSNVSNAAVDQLANTLHDILPPDALVIASADFAHYVTSNEADRQDAITLDALKSLDTNQVGEMFVDSKPTIRSVLAYAKLRQIKEFNLQANSNSAKVVGQLDLPEVTSYFTAYYTK